MRPYEKKINLWMEPFIPALSNKPVINLSSSISDYYNFKKKFFYSQFKKLIPQKLVGIRDNKLEEELKNEIRKFLNIAKKVNNNNLIFGFGSYSILEKLSWKLLPKGLMIGEFPQFKYFPMEYILAGGSYKGFWKKDFSFPEKEIIYKIKNSKALKIIYINNPNNPTGNTINNQILLRVIKKACKKKIFVIIDEVYADLLPVKNSLTKVVNKYNNLIVLRSFSKVWGLQNLRLGYLIADKKIINSYKRICNWNEINNFGCLMALMVLKDKKYLKYLKKQCKQIKKQVINLVIKNGFEVIKSNPLVPLIFIKSKANTNLEKFFAQKNIYIGECGKNLQVIYPKFSQNYARIRIPTNQTEFNQLKKRLLDENY